MSDAMHAGSARGDAAGTIVFAVLLAVTLAWFAWEWRRLPKPTPAEKERLRQDVLVLEARIAGDFDAWAQEMEEAES